MLNDCTQLQIHVIVVLSKIYLFLLLLMILKSRTTSASFFFFFLHRSGNGALTSKYSARQVCFHEHFYHKKHCELSSFFILYYWTLHLPVSLMIGITDFFNYCSLILVFWSYPSFDKEGLGMSKRIKVIVKRLKVNFDKLKH